MEAFIRGLPKAELHVHIEGTLEPELLLSLAAKHHVPLPWQDVESVRAAYSFHDLQSFLDLYYQGMQVLRSAEDFYELTLEYMRRTAAQGVRHVELFFDPQAHTERGVPLEAVLDGIEAGLDEGRKRDGVTSMMILCFLRHLPAESALATLEQARPHLSRLAAVGLDSSELGHPPSKFQAVFDRARELGLPSVAHAGEEGPAAYITEALDLLQVRRVDHGVRCLEDLELVKRLADAQTPLTVCPLSNVKLRVFDTMADHTLAEMLEAGLCATVNSDDPSYFGGYAADNMLEAQRHLGLNREHIVRLARNSISASFLEQDKQRALMAELDDYVAQHAD
ncbi:MAG: adenosine deaminase [Planctomycetota bacterium]|nr:MAG: adenosine deaminase [Planctomycetota bacterium]